MFQGRFKCIVVERDVYLLEMCRYIVLNPVRAGIVDDDRHAIRAARFEHGCPQKEIADHLRLHCTTRSNILKEKH